MKLKRKITNQELYWIMEGSYPTNYKNQVVYLKDLIPELERLKQRYDMTLHDNLLDLSNRKNNEIKIHMQTIIEMEKENEQLKIELDSSEELCETLKTENKKLLEEIKEEDNNLYNKLKEDKDESKENIINNLIKDLWNLFISLEQTHPSDIDDFRHGIHELQKVIGMRKLRRLLPEEYPTFTK